MARLRFPGRPGHRFDRISVRYFEDDVKNISDPAIAFLPQFQRGLQLFRELVGESDEDDEFEGFSVEDLHCAEKKFKQYEHKEKKNMESPKKTSPPPGPTLGTRLKSATQLLDSLPASERTRGRKKIVMRKSYKDIVTEGLVSPSKTLEILKSKDVVSPEDKVQNQKPKPHKVKPTVFKLDEKYNIPGSHVKKSDNKDMAKFLLEKAKQAQKLVQQKREQRLNKKTPVPKREFILPTQSSRSSRVIKPNKRFLEDDLVHSVVKKKSKPEHLMSDEDPETVVQEIKTDKKLKVTEKQAGLLDQPLIVDGKRERKLSLKMKQKSTDFGAWESYEDFDGHHISPSFKPTKNVISPPHLVVTSPLAAPKLGSSLFAKSGTQFQKASEQQRLGMMGLTHSRKPGAAIVQKAKLQLNRDALNKSKAALARSLKAKMKKEAQVEEFGQQVKGENSLSTPQHPVAADGTPHLPADAKQPKKKKQCPVCRSRINLVNCGSALACTACCKFLWNAKKYIGVKEFACSGKGNCVFSPVKKTTCRACRLKKCLEGGLLKGESLTRLTALFYQKYSVSGTEKTHRDKDSVPSGPSTTKQSRGDTITSKTSPVIPAPVTSIPSMGPPLVPPSVTDILKSPVNKSNLSKPCIVTPFQSEPTKISEVQPKPVSVSGNEEDKDFNSPVKVRTMSGEIREHKRKKQKAFKELLRAKQERTENLLAIPDTPKTIPGQQSAESTRTSPHSPGKGPRIKHVCRNAAMVLGKTPARFPSVSEIRLSALPTNEKVQLWKKEEAVKAAMGESDDERPIEEIIQHSTDNVCIVKKSPAHSASKEKKKPHYPVLKGFKIYKRTIRCGRCAGCLTDCCRKCVFCRDMRKFGGAGTMKKACIERKCLNPRIGKPATAAFLDLKDDNSGTDSNAGSAASSPRKPRSAASQVSQQGDIKESQLNGGDLATSAALSVVPLTSGSEVRRLDFGSVPSLLDTSVNGQSHRLPTRTQSGKINSKRIKVDVQEKYAKKTDSTDGQFYPVSLQSVIPASKYWGASLKTPENYPVKVDFKGILSLSALWKQGLALTLAASICVRTVCFLCGSAGKHELIYCNICCEPFHEFCLDEEIPDAAHLDDWVCPRCQFCHVCGRQNNLLQCDKCHDMYHPECLGPNYPTKPSRKKRIWVCTKCVKCKSCGATTPGSAAYATWTYDFSLCYECGQLMDKGNFCPICRKCYSDDDWESKMVQCGMCESWVHAKCEGLSDEMYEILSYMPEDMSFNCRKCFPIGCPEWEMTLKRELRNGLENILQTLIMSKSSHYIYKYEKKKSPKKLCDEKNSPSEITTEQASEKVESMDSEFSVVAKTNQKSSVEKSVKSEAAGHLAVKSGAVGRLAESLTSDRTRNDNSALVSQGKCQNNQNVTTISSTNKVISTNSELSNKAENNVESGIHEHTGSALEDCGNGAVKVSGLHSAKTVKHSSIGRTTGDTKIDISNNEIDSQLLTDASFVDSEPVVTNRHDRTVPVGVDSCDESKSLAVKSSDGADSHLKSSSAQCDSSVQTSDSSAQEESKKDQTNKAIAIKDKGNHVHFADEPVMKIAEPEYAKDLLEVEGKMKDGYYTSVALFSEDIMRIIQVYLDDEEETRCTRKKAVNSARSVFVKQMEKVFPWYNIKTCRYWYSNKDFPRGMLPDATLPPSTDHTYAQWLEREQLPLSPQPSPFKKYSATPVKKLRPLDDEDGEMQTQLEGEDTRKCLLCLKYGDQDSNAAGRLLYCGQDDWVHVNCALWSAEVYEDTDGSLQNLKEAYSRGKMLKCNYCQLSGATVGCNTRGCIANYHFMCAREDKCVFQVDKKIFCKDHRNQADREILSEDRFSVLRRVFVRNLYVRTVKKSWANGLNSANISVVIGSCTVECLGKLTDLSDRPRFLVPVNYMCTRVYWSTKDARRRCVYTCTVREVHPEALKSPIMPIKDMRIIHDETHPDYVPLTQLNLSEMGIDIAKKDNDVRKPSESNVVDLTGTSDIVDLTGYNEDSTQMSMNTSDETLSHVGPLSSSFGGRDSKKRAESASLSESWPGAKCPEKQSSYSVDLTVLSPTTQKLLNMANLKKYTTPENKPKDKSDDFGLLKVADRLNRAAARSRQSSEERYLTPVPPSIRRSRSSSLDAQSVPFAPPARITSPTVDGSMIARPFSPPFRMRSQTRSPSVEKIISPVPFLSSVSAVEIKAARASSVDRVLPARPFSPPHRMPHRARSASLEKTCFSKSILSSDTVAQLSEHRKVTSQASEKIERLSIKPASPAMDLCISPVSSHSAAKSIASMDGKNAECGHIVKLSGEFVSPDPKPVSTSSPLEHKNKFTKINETQDDSDCILIDAFQSSTSGLLTSELESSKEETESAETSNKLEGMSKEVVAAAESDDLADNGTGTVVIMTDSTEEITEEEAILIAQAAIEQSSGNNHVKEFATDESENTENEKENAELMEVHEDSECDRQSESPIKPVDNEVKESSGSPFIPKIVEQPDDQFLLPELKDIKILRKTSESEEKPNDLQVENENCQRTIGSLTPGMISTDSDESDSEIVDITDSIVQASNAVKPSNINLVSGSKNLTNRTVEKDIKIIDSDIEILDSIGSGEISFSESVNMKDGKSLKEKCKEEGVKDIDGQHNRILENNIQKQTEVEESSSQNLNIMEEGVNSSGSEEKNNSEPKVKLATGSQEQETKGDSIKADKMPELDRFNFAVSNSFREEIQAVGVPKDTENEPDDKVNEIGIQKQNTVNTNDEIDEQSALISSLTSFTDSLEKNDNTEKMHLIPLSRSESSEALHVGIIEDIDSDTETSSQPVVTITPEKEGSSNSMDKNIFERMKQFSFTGSLESEKDDRSEAEKHEVLRGLGLERSEDVEKAKKSPKSSQSPLKTYPLRKNMMSPARYRDTDNVLGFCRNGKETRTPEGKKENSALPVLDPIAKKIKLESLAKSSTDARGPFRCKTCKRSYRTETSLQLHREKCDFEVSTSDEDDSESQCDQSISRRTRRKTHRDGTSGSPESSSTRSSLRKSTMVQRVALEVEKKRLQEEEGVPKKRGRPSLSTASKNVTPGRSVSPVVSRLSSRRALQKVDSFRSNKISTQSGIPRCRGRPRKFGNISPEKHKPGRPRKYGDENLQKSVKTITKNLKSRGKVSSQKHQSSLLMNARHLLRQKLLRKRGRPRKYGDTMPFVTKGNDDISADEKAAPNLEEDNPQSLSQQQTNSKYGLRQTRRPGRFVSNHSDEMPVLERSPLDGSNRNADSESDDPPVLIKSIDHKQDSEASNPVCKRGRGRPSKRVTNNLDDTQDTAKDTVHCDVLGSNTGKKRDLPSLRKEVENFRKIKKLKRDSSQESVDVIEINSSEEEVDKSTTSGNNNSDETHHSGVINEQTVTAKGFIKEAVIEKENDRDQKIENERELVHSESTRTSSQANKANLKATEDLHKLGESSKSNTIVDKSKHMETDLKIYCDDSIITNVSEGEHRKSGSGNNNDILGNGNDSDMKTAQTHTNDPVKKDSVTVNPAKCPQNQGLFRNPLNHSNYGHSMSGDVEKEENSSEINMSRLDVHDENKNSIDTGASDMAKKDKNTNKKEDTENIVLGNLEVPGCQKSSLSASRSGQLKGGQGGEESDSVASSSSLSNTVLKLLKEGHKVLIKNPKLGKSFLWEKTEKGYVGRPYEKDVGKSQSSDTMPSRTTATVTSSSATVTSSIAKLENNTPARKDDSMTKLKPFSGPTSTTSSLQELQKINARFNESSNEKSETHQTPETKIRQSTASQVLLSFLSGTKEMKQQTATVTSATSSLTDQSHLTPGSQTQTAQSSSSNSRPSLEYLGTVYSSMRPISVVTESQSINTTISALPTPSPASSIPSITSIALSSVQSRFIGQPQILQTQTQQTGLQTQQTGLLTQQTGLQTQQTGLQSHQAGLQRLPVSNLLPNVYGPNVSHQVAISSTVVPQSVNLLMMSQPQNTLQSSYPSQLAVSKPLTIQVSPQQSTNRPIIVQQVPYINQLPVIVPLGPQAGALSGTGVPQVQDSQTVFHPLLRNTLSQPLGVPTVPVPPNTASSFVSNIASSQTSGFSSKNNETVARDMADVVKNLQKQSDVPFPHQSGSISPGGSIYPFSDALKATAGLTLGSIESRQRDLDNQFTNILKAHPEGGKNFYSKVKHILAKKVLTPKSTTFNHKKPPGHKSIFGYKELKFGIPERHIKVGHMMPKSLSKAEKTVFKKRPYNKRKVGNMSPLKKSGRPRASKRRSPLKTRKIEGPHSLGSSSHPIIHGPKDISSLPAAALEEEVVETPLDAMYDQLDSSQQGNGKNKENRGHLEFEITSDDGFTCKSDTIDGAWRQVIERVQDARAANRLKQLSYGGLNGLSLSGLTHSNTVYLVEQLYGAGYCQTYKFRYHSHELRRHEEPPENPSGCIRTEPFDGRKPYDMFSFLMSRYRVRPETSSSTEDIEMMQKSSRRATSMDLPMAMRFRKLKEHSREAVGVYRSRIHGRGLFCKRSIDGGEMIIEYAGEVIRTSLTDVREKYYESKGIGCYMFRIDDTDVVDATMKGSAARFINHSCEPNCYSKVINVDNRKHIVIFAMRQIQRGEELTYDYKFPIEDVKILCTCGARRCRRYLN